MSTPPLARRSLIGSNGKKGGGGYAGLKISGAKTSVLVTGLGVGTGVDDDGTAVRSPQYGVVVERSECVVDSGIVRGATAGFRDGGGNTTLKKGVNLVALT
jgi:hypothetical protein